jgi:DNA-binding MarR family transcriptional regulator
MKIEEELKQENFKHEQMKAQLNILFTASWLTNQFTAILKPYNISQEQFNVLRILRGQQGRPICQKEILVRMIDKNSNLTLIIRKLTDKNLIEVLRSETDKREYQIRILPAGLDLLSKLDAIMDKPEHNFINLTPSEAFHINALLDKLRSA